MRGNGRGRLGLGGWLAAAVLAALLAWPAGAGAAVTRYEGSIETQPGSSFGFDLTTKRSRGEVKRTVTRVRGSFDVYCRGSDSVPVSLRSRMRAPVGRDDRFSGTRYSESQGFTAVTNLRGELRQNDRISSGQVTFTGENPIFDSCSSGVLDFTAERVRPAP